MEEMLTMRPTPRSSMWGRTWRASVIGTSRLTPMTREVVGILLSDLTDDLDAGVVDEDVDRSVG